MITGRVYKIVDECGQCYYVGSTVKSLRARMIEHRSHQRAPTVINQCIRDQHDKVFTIELLREVEVDTIKDLRFLEQEAINQLRPLCNINNAWCENALKEAIKRYRERNPEKVRQWGRNRRERQRAQVVGEVCE